MLNTFRLSHFRSRILIFAGFLLGMLAAITLGSSVVRAQSLIMLTDDQKQLIVSNCISIKTSLNQLHVTDALLRVNRGQVYESMGTRLMDRFNDRLGSNNLDNKAMLSVTGSYRGQLNTFRSDYIKYEQSLSATIATDCTTNPTLFHMNLMEARRLRGIVHSDVLKLHQLIDDYRSSVGDFLLNYERVSD